MNLIGRFSSSSPPTRLHLSFSHSPASKYATCFSCDAHAMEESRRSREALYLQGICVDASVNDPRVRGDADTCVYRPSARGTRIRGASALFIQDRTCNRSIGHYACRKDILFGTTPRSKQVTSAPFVEKSVMTIKLLTTREAAAELGLSIRAVQMLIERGRLPAQKLGRDHLIRLSDLERARHRPGRGRPRARKPR